MVHPSVVPDLKLQELRQLLREYGCPVRFPPSLFFSFFSSFPSFSRFLCICACCASARVWLPGAFSALFFFFFFVFFCISQNFPLSAASARVWLPGAFPPFFFYSWLRFFFNSLFFPLSVYTCMLCFCASTAVRGVFFPFFSFFPLCFPLCIYASYASARVWLPGAFCSLFLSLFTLLVPFFSLCLPSLFPFSLYASPLCFSRVWLTKCITDRCTKCDA